MKNIVYIVNPHSGVGKKRTIARQIKDYYSNTIVDNVQITVKFTTHAGHARELAEFYRDKVECVVAVGGDGTVNEIGTGLIGSGTALGIIPCGSGNGLARELDIPLRTEQAIQVINDGRVRLIDVMKLDNHYSLNVAGIGFDAYISHKFSKVKTRGPLAYMNLIAREYPNYISKDYILNIDTHIFQRKAFLVSFANSAQWGNNIKIAPNAQIDDGLIDVCILSEFPNYAVPSLLLSLFNQTIEKNKYDEIIRAKHIEFNNPQPLLGHVDGEPITIQPNSSIEIEPLALKVIVPTDDFYKASRFNPSVIRNNITQFAEGMLNNWNINI